MEELEVKKPKGALLKMWVHPRKTIKEVISYNPNFRFWLLSFIYGFTTLSSLFQKVNIASIFSLGIIIVALIILSTLCGYVFFSIFSYIVYLTGKWLKGTGTYKEVRAAQAYSNVTKFVNFIIVVLLIGYYQEKIFIDSTFGSLTTIEGYVLMGLIPLYVALFIWGIVLYIAAIAEVQKMTIAKAFFNIFLSALIYFVLYFLVASLFIWKCSPYFDEPLVTLGLL
ncbi:MAG TPA: YIP1 family protein [Chlamydiales bacterium]|nr:YIP1 family protein [Chlamydiales bacterium]